MARMENYFFTTVTTQQVIIPEGDEHYSLAGNCYGREGFNDGDAIVTSRVKSIDNYIVTTYSNTQYALGKMHPDYIELLCTKESGMPIIYSWKLEGDAKSGYIMHGFTGEDYISGKVQAQDGNFVVIDGVKYYVIWRNICSGELSNFAVLITGRYLDMVITRDFVPYMNDPHAKPILFE